MPKDPKANYILSKLLEKTTTNSITSIIMPRCLSLYQPEQEEKLKTILSRCPTLNDLNLSMNQLWPKTAANLAETFQKCKALTRLDLSFNHVTQYNIKECFGTLLSALSVCPLLTHLNLRGTEIEDDAVPFLA
jgi:hypothetical protein